MTDLRALLDVPADEIKKPPVWPVGDYHGFIEKYEDGETRDKKTPYLRVFVKTTRADESIPSDLLEGIDTSKRTFRTDFYLLEDKSQHWRLKDMLEKIGVDMSGESLASAVPKMVGKPVRFSLTQKANQDNTEMFNELVQNQIIADA